MVVTMPSPTRAMIVSSFAPPTKRSRWVGVIESDVSGLEAGSKAAASGLGMMR
jgi:hypothetical protein